MTGDAVTSSADAGTGPRPAGDPWAIWMTRFIAAAAILLVVGFAVDLSGNEAFGLDARVNCAAVDAHIEGLDPYFVKNLKGTKLSYPYLPVTLDAFRPLCAGGFLVAHQQGIYLILAVLCALLLPSFGGVRPSLRDIALRVVFALGGFLGFEWVLATGNFAMLSGLLTAAALALLLRQARSERQGRASFLPLLAGAAVLGLVTSFKLVFFPVLAALYFLPQPRKRKLILIAVAIAMFSLPILISMVFYANLFPSWLSAISGQIAGQHAPGDDVNPSLMFLSLILADRYALAGCTPVVAAIYGFAAVALVIAPLAVSVWREIGAQRSAEVGSPLATLDRWLMDHPRAAMRITVLAMYAFHLCAPRLKEYAFFELALYTAVLIADLPAAAAAAVLSIGIVLPTVVSISGSTFMGGFSQIAVALACFWVMLLAQFAPSALVVRAAGVEPAQRLRTEGF